MRVAAYCRFSSAQQNETSIRDQLRNIEGYCQRSGWPAPALYQDQAISGARKDRPGYQAMLEAAELRVFDVLLVDDLSRLSRDHIESAQTIRLLKFAGIRVVGVSDGTDTARDGYKLETGLRGLMSEFYLDDLAKKTHRGLMGQALEGYSAGGLPYGYASEFDGSGYRRLINQEQAQWVRYIFEQYATGHSVRHIAADLNAKGIKSPRGKSWAHSALYPDAKGVGILSNAMYNGRQIWNKTEWIKDPITGRRKRKMRPVAEWVISEAPELKIVDDALWAACEARYQQTRLQTAEKQRINGQGSGGRGPKYLFSGLLKCGVCGASYIMTSKTHYGCSAHSSRGDAVCANKKMIKRATVEDVLLAGIKKSLLSDDAYREFERTAREMIKATKPDAGAIKKRAQAAEKEISNILGAIKAGIVTSSTKTALLAAEGALADAEYELKAVSAYEPTQMLPRAREIYRDLVSRLECVSDIAAAREAIRSLIGDVSLVPEQGTLTALFRGDGLAESIQVTLVAGTRFGRYPQIREKRIIRITGLK